MEQGIIFESNSFKQFNDELERFVDIAKKIDTRMTSIAQAINKIKTSTIDAIAKSFKTLNDSLKLLDGRTANKVVNFLAKLKEAVSGRVSGFVKFNTFLEDLSTNFKKLTGLSFSSVVSELSSIVFAAKSFSGVDTTKISKFIIDLTNLAGLTSGTSKLKDFFNSISRIVDGFNSSGSFTSLKTNLQAVTKILREFVGGFAGIQFDKGQQKLSAFFNSIGEIVRAGEKLGKENQTILEDLDTFSVGLKTFTEKLAKINPPDEKLKNIFNAVSRLVDVITKEEADIVKVKAILDTLTDTLGKFGKEMASIKIDDSRINALIVTVTKLLTAIKGEDFSTVDIHRIFDTITDSVGEFAREMSSIKFDDGRLTSLVSAVTKFLLEIGKEKASVVDAHRILTQLTESIGDFARELASINIDEGKLISFVTSITKLMKAISDENTSSVDIGRILDTLTDTLGAFAREMSSIKFDDNKLTSLVNSIVRFVTLITQETVSAIEISRVFDAITDSVGDFAREMTSIKFEDSKLATITNSVAGLVRALLEVQVKGKKLDFTGMKEQIGELLSYFANLNLHGIDAGLNGFLVSISTFFNGLNDLNEFAENVKFDKIEDTLQNLTRILSGDSATVRRSNLADDVKETIGGIGDVITGEGTKLQKAGTLLKNSFKGALNFAFNKDELNNFFGVTGFIKRLAKINPDNAAMAATNIQNISKTFEALNKVSQSIKSIEKFDDDKLKNIKNSLNQLFEVFGGDSLRTRFGNIGSLFKNLKTEGFSKVGKLFDIFGNKGIISKIGKMDLGGLGKLGLLSDAITSLVDVVSKIGELDAGKIDIGKIEKLGDGIKKLVGVFAGETLRERIAGGKKGLDALFGKRSIFSILDKVDSSSLNKISTLVDAISGLTLLVKDISTIEFHKVKVADITKLGTVLNAITDIFAGSTFKTGGLARFDGLKKMFGKRGIFDTLSSINISGVEKVASLSKAITSLVDVVRKIAVLGKENGLTAIRNIDFDGLGFAIKAITKIFASSKGGIFGIGKISGVFDSLSNLKVDVGNVEKLINSITKIVDALRKAKDINTGDSKELASSIRGFFDAINQSDGKAGNFFESINQIDDGSIGKLNALADAFSKVATAITDGLKSGLDVAEIEKVGAAIGKILVGSTEQALGIASPSKVFMDIGEDVVEGFSVGLQGFKDVMDDPIGFLKSSVSKLRDFFSSINIGNPLDALRDSLKSKGIIHFGDFQAVVETQLEGIRDTIIMHSDTLRESAENMMDNLGKGLEKGIISAIQVVQFLLIGIPNIIFILGKRIASQIKDTLGNLEIVQILSKVFSQAKTMLGNVLIGIGNIVAESMIGIAERIQKVGIKEAFREQIVEILPSTKRVFEKVVNTIASSMSDVIDLMRRIDFQEVFETQLDLLVLNARRQFEKLVNLVGGYLSDLVDKIRIVGIKEALDGELKALLTNVKQVFLKILNVASDFVVKIIDIFRRIDFKNLSFSGVGQSITQGLEDGLKNVEPVGRRIGSQLIDGAKSVLGIASPSRVFFAIGGNIVDGLKGGLSGIVGMFKKVFDRVIDFAKDIPNKIGKAFGSLGNMLKDSIGDIGNGFGKATRAAKRFAGAINPARLVRGLSDVGFALGNLRDGFETIRDIARQAFDATLGITVQFESAFAGVAKTLNATDEQLATVREGLMELATSPDSLVSGLDEAFVSLSRIAEAGGQLGIDQSSIVDFSDTIAQLTMASNLTEESASFALARIDSIFQSGGENFDELGSTIVALGNNVAATESDIIALTQRIIGTSAAAGLSQAEMLGWAASIRAAGINAESGGTSFNTLLNNITKAISDGGEELALFADLSGQTVETFSDQWENDASGALTSFIEGLGELDNAQRVGVLGELGLDAVRMSDFLTLLSQNTEGLTDTLEIANQGWEDNNALQLEAAARAATLESSINRLKNVALGVGDLFGQFLTPAFVIILDNLTQGMSKFGDILADNREEIQAGVNAFFAFFGAIGNAVGAFINFISAITVGTRPVVDFWETVGNMARGFVDILMSATDAMNSFADNANNMVNSLIGLPKISLFGEGEGEGVAETFDNAKASAEGFFDTILGRHNEVSSPLGRHDDKDFSLEGLTNVLTGNQALTISAEVEDNGVMEFVHFIDGIKDKKASFDLQANVQDDKLSNFFEAIAGIKDEEVKIGVDVEDEEVKEFVQTMGAIHDEDVDIRVNTRGRTGLSSTTKEIKDLTVSASTLTSIFSGTTPDSGLGTLASDAVIAKDAIDALNGSTEEYTTTVTAGEIIQIEAGDTLSALALEYGTTVDELVRLNNIENPDLIFAGADLIVSGEITESLVEMNDELEVSGDRIAGLNTGIGAVDVVSNNILAKLFGDNPEADAQEVSDSMDLINDSISAIQSGFSDLNVNNVGNFLKTLSKSFKNFGTEGLNIFENLFGEIDGSGILEPLKKVKDSVLGFFDDFFLLDEGTFDEGLTNVLDNIPILLTKFLTKGFGFGFGLSLFDLLAEVIEKDLFGFDTFIDTTFGDAGKGLTDAIVALGNILDLTIGSLLDFVMGRVNFSELLSNLSTEFEALGDGLVTLINGTLGNINQDLGMGTGAIVDFIADAIVGLLDIASGEKTVQQAVADFLASTSENFRILTSSLKGMFDDLVVVVLSAFGIDQETFAGIFDGIFAFSDLIKDFFDIAFDLTTLQISPTEALNQLIDTLVENVQVIFNGLVDIFVNAIKGLFSFADVIEGAFSNEGETGTIMNAIKGFFLSFFNLMIEVASFIFSPSNWAKLVALMFAGLLGIGDIILQVLKPLVAGGINIFKFLQELMFGGEDTEPFDFSTFFSKFFAEMGSKLKVAWNDFLTFVVTDFGSGFTEVWDDIFGEGATANLVKNLLDIFNKAMTFIQGLIDSIFDFFDFSDEIEQIKDAFRPETIIDTIFEFWRKIGDAIGFAIGFLIGAILRAPFEVVKAWVHFFDLLGQLFRGEINIGEFLFTLLVQPFIDFFSMLGGFIQSLFPNIDFGAFFKGIMKTLTNWWNALTGFIAMIFSNDFDLGAFLRDLFTFEIDFAGMRKAFGNWLKAFGDGSVSLLKKVLTALKGFFTGLAQGFVRGFTQAFGAENMDIIGKWFNNIADAFKSFDINSILKFFGDIGKRMLAGLVRGFTLTFSAGNLEIVGQWFNNIAEAFKSFDINGILTFFGDIGKRMLAGIGQFFGNIEFDPSAIGDFLGGFGDFFATAFSKLFDFAGFDGSSILKGIGNFFSSMLGGLPAIMSGLVDGLGFNPIEMIMGLFTGGDGEGFSFNFDFITNALTTAKENLETAISGIATFLTNLVFDPIGTLTTLFSFEEGALDSIGLGFIADWISDGKDTLDAAFVTLATFFTNLVFDPIGTITDLFSIEEGSLAELGIIMIVDKITEVKDNLELAINAFQIFIDGLEVDPVTAITDLFNIEEGSLAEMGVVVVVDTIMAIKDDLELAINNITTFAEGLTTNPIETIMGLFQTAEETFTFDNISTEITDFIDTVKTNINNFIDWIQGLLVSPAKALMDSLGIPQEDQDIVLAVMDTVIDSIQEKLTTFVTDIGTNITNAFDILSDAFELFLGRMEAGVLRAKLATAIAAENFNVLSNDTSGSDRIQSELDLRVVENQVLNPQITVSPDIIFEAITLAGREGLDTSTLLAEVTEALQADLEAGEDISIDLNEIVNNFSIDDTTSILEGLGLDALDVSTLFDDLISEDIDTSEFAQLATDMIDGLSAGLDDADVEGEGEDIGDEIITGAHNALGIASPSKEFIKIGEQLIEGLSIGIEKGLTSVGLDTIAQDISEMFDKALAPEKANKLGFNYLSSMSEGMHEAFDMFVEVIDMLIGEQTRFEENTTRSVDFIITEYIRMVNGVIAAVERYKQALSQLANFTTSVAQQIINAIQIIPIQFAIMTDKIIANQEFLRADLRETADLVSQIGAATQTSAGSAGSAGGKGATGKGRAFGGEVTAGRQYEILEPNQDIPFEIFNSAESGRSFFIPRESGNIVSPLAQENGGRVPNNFGNVPQTMSAGQSTMVINNNMKISVPVNIEGNGTDIDVEAIQRTVIEAVNVANEQMSRSNNLTERLSRRGAL